MDKSSSGGGALAKSRGSQRWGGAWGGAGRGRLATESPEVKLRISTAHPESTDSQRGAVQDDLRKILKITVASPAIGPEGRT